MKYEQFISHKLKELKSRGNYRVFASLKRISGSFPYAKLFAADGSEKKIISWCANDYLGMGQNKKVIDQMHLVLDECGAGAGGTRNISGTNQYHVELEKVIAQWYNKESALSFTSGYTANLATLSTLGRMLDNAIIISDSKNHNSMIEGIKGGRSDKTIFRHNDMEHLEQILSSYPHERHKVIAFESVYSMDGDIAPIKDICDLADKYNALTYVDEVHAVGLYGETGSGVCEMLGLRERIDIIQGTMAKGMGLIGGFIAASKDMVDFIRSFGYAFIFSTAVMPAVAAGAIASIEYLKANNGLRQRHQQQALYLKKRLSERLEVLDTASHIVPLMVRNAVLAKKTSDLLLNNYGHYVQPINYPTVAVGEERLRFAPTPFHSDGMIDLLVEACFDVWDILEIPCRK